MQRPTIIPVLIGAIVLAACGGREGPSQEELAQMRQDSIAAAEQARRDSVEAERARQQARQDSIAEAQRRQAAAAREAERAREVIAERVHFGYDQSNIRDEAQEILVRKVSVLRANPDVRVRIEGHADERGSVEYNLALGARRADAVRDFLGAYGLDTSRFETVTFGEERPLDPGSNESAWEQNRRAEFNIISGGEELTEPVSR